MDDLEKTLEETEFAEARTPTQHLDVLNKLMEQIAFSYYYDNGDEFTGSFVVAVEYGHVDVVKDLLENAGVDVNAKEINGWTALHYAASYGHVAVVETLLEQANVDVLVKTNTGDTALHHAVMDRHVDVVKILLDVGVDANARGGDGTTALHPAAMDGSLAIVKLLLGHVSVNVNAKCEYDWTALHWAACFGCIDVYDGVKVNAKSNDGSTALHHAADCGYVNVIKAFLQHDGKTALDYAKDSCDVLYAENGRHSEDHQEVMELLIAAGGR
ncbi:ANK [Seminavis robusta]|uniref:ANK n=1 Tax=Seminavis robusta TaxID=568900 RepID=A0A9N8HPU5_9STRA|nr:ANK [Seminavis robusta]|eukprot:Sro929_g221370.1 ANK (271) ;mRNA; r:35268-36208